MKVASAFILAARLGYGGVEVMVTPDRRSQDAKTLNELKDRYETPITSIHAPTLIACTFVWGTNPEYKLWKTAELAEAVGASSMVVHPPFAKNPYSKRFLDVTAKVEKESGIHVAVENMFPWSARSKQFEIYGPSWEATTKISNSLTLDFSHAAAGDLNILDFIKNHHKQLKVIHLTDGTARSRIKGDPIIDEHLLPGQGNMPIKETYQYLRNVNWQGSTVLEINTRNKRTILEKMEPLRESLSYFNSLYSI